MRLFFVNMILISSSVFGMNAGEFLVSNEGNLTGSCYNNPIIAADYSDPDVVASPDGKTFYMTASSFQSTPGLPILKSEDLVNWRIVNYALDTLQPTDYFTGTPRHGKGVWAPSIRYHQGEYYIYWGDPDYGIYMIKSTNPEQKWSEPVLVKAGKGLIDPCPLWDEDGKVYLVNGYAASRIGFNSVITVSELNSEGTKEIGKPRIVYDGNDGVNHTIEGPKLYKKGEYYYIFSPAGGVVDGWQLVMRSKNIYGPYESKIVMRQGDTDINGPHQGAWVSTSTGEDWFLHFQDRGLYGRIIHLNPMSWVDEWPVIGLDSDGDGCGFPVRNHRKPNVGNTINAKHNRDNTDDHSMLYQWHANYENSFGFPIPHGLMRIYGFKTSGEEANLWNVPNLWLQKFPSEEFELISKVIVSAKGNAEGVSSGLTVMGSDYARLGLKKVGDEFELQFITRKDADQPGTESINNICKIKPSRTYEAGLYPNLEREIYLKLKVGKDGECDFYYSLDGKRYEQAGHFKAKSGKWIGAKTGYYSIVPEGVNDRGWIDIISNKLIIK